MRSTSAMTTPIPMIKRPPAAAFGLDPLSPTRSDYTGRAAMPANAVKTTHYKKSWRAPASKDWTERKAQGVRIRQASALAKIPWLVHGFSTRPGGVSELGGEKVLNLGFAEWDARENVLENRRRFQSVLGAESLLLCGLSQIHSDVVQLFDAPPSAPCRGDAATTNRPGL